MKLLKLINEMFADQGSGHAAKDSKSRDGKRKFVVTIKRGDGTEIEKNVKAFSIGDIKHHFGKDFVDAELHPDEMVDDDETDDDDRTADEVDADEQREQPKQRARNAAEAGRGQRASDRPADDVMEGGPSDGYGAMVVKFGFQRQKAAGTYRSKVPGAGTIRINQHGHWTHSDVGTTDATKDYEGTTVSSLERHLKAEGFMAESAGPECKPPSWLDAEEKYAYRKGFENPDDTPEDWEFSSKSKQGKAFMKGRAAATEVDEALTEMAKRSKPDDFYAMAKKKYGADKVKALKWPEIVAVAKENDVLIPPYLRTQKVGRGTFNLVPPEHADSKPAPKVEPKAEPKKEEPKAEPKYEMPQLENTSYNDWSEFYKAMKARYGDIDLKRVEHGKQGRGRFGTPLGSKLMVDTKTGTVMGVWEVTGDDKVPGRGMVAYGYGNLAKAKQEKPKDAPKPAERRKGGVASEDEMKAALLDAASEMRHHKLGHGADWRTKPEKQGKGFEVETRYWGHWEGDDGSGDYDHQEFTRDSSKVVAGILQQVEKRHPKVALSFQTGEKNWLYIRAE